MSAVRVTNRTDYAVRSVIYLSMREPGEVVPISEIASGTGLSVKFLEEILLLLRTAGIVQSRRGKQGGYSLLRPAHELTVADVVHALEGDLSSSGEEGITEECPYHRVTHDLFKNAAEEWWRCLSESRLSKLAEEVRRLGALRQTADMFHI